MTHNVGNIQSAQMPNGNALGRPTRFLVFGFRRGGSSIFFELLQNLFMMSGLPCDDVVARLARTGVDLTLISQETLESCLDENMIIGMFRDVTPAIENLGRYDIRPILITRDPIDCAVSWYFARSLHTNDATPPVFDEKQSLYDYIENNDDLIESIERISRFFKGRDGLIVQYEELLRNPVKVLKSVFDFLDQSKLTRGAFDMTLLRAQFTQIIEDHSSHQRIGRPAAELPEQVRSVLYRRYEKIRTEFSYIGEAREQNGWEGRQELDALKRTVLALYDENHRRLTEIRELERTTALLLERVADLSHENGFRIKEIANLKLQSVVSSAHGLDEKLSDGFAALEAQYKAAGKDFRTDAAFLRKVLMLALA